jgi:uncharacterized RDD family membrane protein YckC
MEKYETLGRRFGALILDSLILIPVNLVVSFLTVLMSWSPGILTVSSALGGVISVSYYILMHYQYGQTLGKMVMKVKVLDDSEGAINFGQAVIRSLPQLIPAMFAVSFSTADRTDNLSASVVGTLISGLVSIFWIADVIVCLVNDKRRALHDFIAGTIVVRTDV